MSKLSQLEGLQGAEAAAKGAVGDAQRHRRDAAVGLEQAGREVHEHLVGVHAGEVEADPDRLDALYARVHEHQQLTTLRLVQYPDGPEAKIIDVAGEAAVEGAQRRLAAAEQAVEQFVRENLPTLAAERARLSQQVGIRAVAAAAAASRSRTEWEIEARWWTQTLRLAGQADLATSIPVNPFVTLEPAAAGTERGPIPHTLFP